MDPNADTYTLNEDERGMGRKKNRRWRGRRWDEEYWERKRRRGRRRIGGEEGEGEEEEQKIDQKNRRGEEYLEEEEQIRIRKSIV